MSDDKPVNHFLWVYLIQSDGTSWIERLSGTNRSAVFAEVARRVQAADPAGANALELGRELRKMAAGPDLLCASLGNPELRTRVTRLQSQDTDGGWHLTYDTAEIWPDPKVQAYERDAG